MTNNRQLVNAKVVQGIVSTSLSFDEIFTNHFIKQLLLKPRVIVFENRSTVAKVMDNQVPGHFM